MSPPLPIYSLIGNRISMLFRLIGKLFLVSSLFVTTHAWALKPSRTYAHVPSDFHMDFQDVYIATSDSASIHAWYIANDHYTQRTLIICHNGEGNMGDYLDRVDQCLNLEYNVLIFDYRGFGSSSFFGVDPSVQAYPQFINDLNAVIKYCRAGSVYPVVLYGWGMGGTLAMGVGYHDNRVDYIIAEAPYLTINNATHGASTVFPQKYQPLYTVNSPPAKTLKGLLFLLGDSDPNRSATEALKAKWPRGIKVEVLPGVNGDNGFDVDASYYFDRISSFLDGFYHW